MSVPHRDGRQDRPQLLRRSGRRGSGAGDRHHAARACRCGDADVRPARPASLLRRRDEARPRLRALPGRHRRPDDEGGAAGAGGGRRGIPRDPGFLRSHRRRGRPRRVEGRRAGRARANPHRGAGGRRRGQPARRSARRPHARGARIGRHAGASRGDREQHPVRISSGAGQAPLPRNQWGPSPSHLCQGDEHLHFQQFDRRAAPAEDAVALQERLLLHRLELQILRERVDESSSGIALGTAGSP